MDVLGTRQVVDACLKAEVTKLIVTSSGAAYGYHADWGTEAGWATRGFSWRMTPVSFFGFPRKFRRLKKKKGPSLVSQLRGVGKVRAIVREIPLSEIPRGDRFSDPAFAERFRAWLNEAWRRKDAEIEAASLGRSQ